MGNPFGVPAVSVHVYSPPLRMQRYYDFADGELIEIAAMPADDDFPADPQLDLVFGRELDIPMDLPEQVAA